MRKCRIRKKVEKAIANRNRKRLRKANKTKKHLGSSKDQEKKLMEVLDSFKKWAI